MSVNFIMYQNRNRTNTEWIYFEFYLEIFKYSPFHTWPYIYKLINLWAENKTLWFWQNNYILCPVCVSSPPEFFSSRQSHNVTILYNACWREEEVCHSYMPRGPGYQRYDIRAEARQTKTQEKIRCYQSSKCQGCSPATTINQLMGWFIPMVAMFLSFPKVYFWVGAGREVVRANCCLGNVKVCDSWGTFCLYTWITEHHVQPKLLYKYKYNGDNLFSMAELTELKLYILWLI